MDENSTERRIQSEFEGLINTWKSQIVDKFSKSTEELKEYYKNQPNENGISFKQAERYENENRELKAKLFDNLTMLSRHEQELGEAKKTLKEVLNSYVELSSRFREQTRELDTVRAEFARITGTAGNDEESDDVTRVKDEPVVIIENADESDVSEMKAKVFGAVERIERTVRESSEMRSMPIRTVATSSSTNFSTSTPVTKNKNALNAVSSSTSSTNLTSTPHLILQALPSQPITAATSNGMIGTIVPLNNFLPVQAQSARSFILNTAPNNQVTMQNGNHTTVISAKALNPQNTPIPNGTTVLQSANNQMTRLAKPPQTQPPKLIPQTQSHTQIQSSSMPVLKPNNQISSRNVDNGTTVISENDTNKNGTNGYSTDNNNKSQLSPHSSNGSDDDIMLIDNNEEEFPFTSNITPNNGQGRGDLLSGAQLTELYKMSPSVGAFASRLLKYYFTENELSEQHTTVDGTRQHTTLKSLDPVRIGYIQRNVMETTGRMDNALWAECTQRMHIAIHRVRKRHTTAPNFRS